jgi:hypothetical protein
VVPRSRSVRRGRGQRMTSDDHRPRHQPGAVEQLREHLRTQGFFVGSSVIASRFLASRKCFGDKLPRDIGACGVVFFGDFVNHSNYLFGHAECEVGVVTSSWSAALFFRLLSH